MKRAFLLLGALFFTASVSAQTIIGPGQASGGASTGDLRARFSYPVPTTPGFDYIGPAGAFVKGGTGQFYWSYEEFAVNTTEVTAVPFRVHKKQKVREIWTVYSSYGDVLDLATINNWQVDIWSSEDALIANPWFGDVHTESFVQPSFGDMATPVTGGFNPGYIIGFNITDKVLNTGSLFPIEYYIGVRPIIDVFNQGSGGIKESLVNVDMGTYAFDYTSQGWGTGWAHTPFFGQSATAKATPAYRAVAVFCPESGPC